MKYYFKQIVILLLILLVALGALFGVFIYQNAKLSLSLTQQILSFNVELSNGDKDTVKGWYNEQDDNWYLFLPAQAVKAKQINNDKRFKTEYFLNGELKDDISLVENETKYSFRIKKEAAIKSTGNLFVMKSQNIPSLFINTKSGSIEDIHQNKAHREDSSISVYSFETSENFKTDNAELSGRGNTSWTSTDKKGYLLNLLNEAPLASMKPSTEWILLAHPSGKYLANSLAFELEKMVGMPNVVDSRSVDLYLNNEYVGNYLLCERISIGRQNINISSLDEQNEILNPTLLEKNYNRYVSENEKLKGFHLKNEPADSTGGFLLERDVPEYWAGEDSGFIADSGDHYVVHAPRFVSVNQVNYIYSFMNDLYKALESPNGYNKETNLHYTDYIDADSFALKYIVEEFLAFNDAGRSSAYYYKNSDKLDSKLYAGPGWDFEGSFNLLPNEITHLNSNFYSTALYELLYSHDEFANLVKDYYYERLRPSAKQLFESILPQMQGHIEASANMSDIRWQTTPFANYCQETQRYARERMQFFDSFFKDSEQKFKIKAVHPSGDKVFIYKSLGETVTKQELCSGILDDTENMIFIDNETKQELIFPLKVQNSMVINSVSEQNNSQTVFLRLKNMVSQVVPELVFGLVFILVFAIYLFKNIKHRRNKK